MRLKITKSAHSNSYSVIKSAYKNKKITSVVVERLGNDKYICETYGVDDAEAWARAHVAELNEKAKEDASVSIAFSPVRSIPLDKQRSFNAGYLFLQDIYYDLGLHKICTAIKRKYKFSYNLNSILSRLVYSRILYPGSKKNTAEQSLKFIEAPDFELHQIYRALSLLAAESDYIQSILYRNSLKMSARRTDVIYYDCTNYYFETEEADGDRQYGYSKEHRPNPIVQMGLFMDRDGIPLAFCINPGNTNEQVTLRPLEQKLLSDFSLSRFIVCTDAGLSSTESRIFNNRGGRAFITTQSVKKLKQYQEEWLLDEDGWSRPGCPGEVFRLSDLDEEKDKETVLYKERWINEDGLEQRIIASYSLKYRDYTRALRQRQVERAKKKVAHPSGLKNRRPTDDKRFIKEERCTKEGEVAEHSVYSINEERIAQEEKYDGFYAVCTNLEDEAEEIIRVNRQRWQIEECFRIMKHEFKARPAYLQRDERIKAHFMTCFIALIIFRYLEIRMENKYTAETLIQQLRDMNMTKIEGYGYIPSYDRTELTDRLHQEFGFDTSKELIPIAKMRNICKNTKK
ncbi:MAG: IS1634 family transposase [Eubacterium sp.]|nr:IS1634 family transposase [Eubacterium sp.]